MKEVEIIQEDPNLQWQDKQVELKTLVYGKAFPNRQKRTGFAESLLEEMHRRQDR